MAYTKSSPLEQKNSSTGKGTGYADAVKSSSRQGVELQTGKSFESQSGHTSDVVKKKKPGEIQDEDGRWVLVERLKKRKLKAVVGSNKEQSCLSGVEMKRRDTWDIYVGNLKDDVTDTQIMEYLGAKEVVGKACYLLSSKIYGTKSARVRVDIESKDRVLESNFWPEHVRVRSCMGH